MIMLGSKREFLEKGDLVNRSAARFYLVLISLAISSFASGQSKDSPTKEAQTRDRRLEEARTDIRLLKQVVAEQARRITELEKAVKTLQAAAGNTDKRAEDREKADREKAAVRPFSGPAWQNPFAWTQIRMGMSRAAVEDILGPPTTADSVLDYQTLTYKGETAGGVMLSATIKFTDDRVSEVIPPAF